MSKAEVFSRTVPWYEITPSERFIYKDKTTNLWFVIERVNARNEIQGAGYALATAYRRYAEECEQQQREATPLDLFDEYDKLDRVDSWRVKQF